MAEMTGIALERIMSFQCSRPEDENTQKTENQSETALIHVQMLQFDLNQSPKTDRVSSISSRGKQHLPRNFF